MSSYATLELAENAVSRAQSLFNEEFTTIFNRKANLYGIRSKIYKSRIDALEVLFNYQKSEFSEPALVVIKNRDGKSTEATYNAIQISAFRTLSRAKKDATLSSIKLDTETYIHKEESTGWYKVHILKAKPYGELTQNLQRIKQKDFFSDAFINTYDTQQNLNNIAAAEITFKYQVHVEGVTEESAQAFRSSIMNPENTDSNILQPKTDLIVFEGINSWNEVVRLKRNLSKVSTIGRPVIVIVEE
ncbi:MAG: hypothetical protein U5J95_05675 [Balneolaceae bacterium]|nr:hypothetical protein [Balneolaceae bacterium]